VPKVPGLPSLTGPPADWRQFDSFFTFVVKRFGGDVPANLKDSLGEKFQVVSAGIEMAVKKLLREMNRFSFGARNWQRAHS
jgi:hypothetical protein